MISSAPRVLVLDSAPEISRTLRDALDPLNAAVLHARSGQELFDSASADSPVACVVINGAAPEVDALASARLLRAAPPLRALSALVLIPEETDEAELIRALDGEEVEILPVSLSPVLLRGRIRSLISAAARCRELECRMAEQSAQLEAHQSWLSIVTDSLPALISFVDKDLVYRFHNRAYMEWFGSAGGDLRGKRVSEVVGDKVFEARRHAVEAALAGEHVHLQSFAYHQQLGRRITETEYVPHFDEQGQVTGFAVLGMDITDRDREERRRKFLLAASDLLAGTIENFEQTLQKVVHLAVPELADWCAFDVLEEEGGRIRRVAAAHPTPELGELTALIEERWPTTPDLPGTVPKVLRTGEPELVSDVTDELLAAAARDPEHLELIRRLGLRSLLSVPLMARGRTIGALTFATSRSSGLVLTENDIGFAMDLAHRSALTFDNASLLQVARESEERYRTLADNMAQQAWMTDETGWVIWYNRRWFEYTGTTLEQVQGWKWESLHHPDHHARVMEKFRDCLAKGTPWEDTYPLRGRDSTYRWFLSRAVPIRSESGRVIRWFGTNTDITEQRNAEEALRLREERYRLASLATNDAIWDWDLQTNMIEWNEAIHTVFGRRLGDFHDSVSWWKENIHEDDRERVITSIHDTIDGDQTAWVEEYRFRRGDGTWAFVLDRGYVLRDQTGRPLRMIGAMQDMSREREGVEFLARLNAELELARDAALEASQTKSQFLANMSHELRTPLNAILGYAEMLHEETVEKGEQRMTRDLERVLLSARHLLAVISDILDLSKIEAGRMEFDLEPLDPAEVACEAASLAIPLAEVNGNSIRVVEEENDGAQQCWILRGDRTRLRQVLFNLLSNAAKFTEQGEILLACRFREPDASGQATVELSVSDTGVGMTPEQIDRLFRMFEQLDSSPRRRHGGSGLGLAISQRLVELMGGTITVESEPSRGSTFTVHLPLEARAAK